MSGIINEKIDSDLLDERNDEYNAYSTRQGTVTQIGRYRVDTGNSGGDIGITNQSDRSTKNAQMAEREQGNGRTTDINASNDNTQRSKAGLDDSAFSMPENDDEVSYSFEDDVVDKTSSLAERVRLGEISQTEYLNELQRLMNEATEKYGAIPKGENPKVDVTVPKQVSDKRNTRRKNNKKES